MQPLWNCFDIEIFINIRRIRSSLHKRSHRVLLFSYKNIFTTKQRFFFFSLYSFIVPFTKEFEYMCFYAS